MELSERQLAIIRAVSHFDVLDYPLTLSEIIKFSGSRLEFGPTREILLTEPLNGMIGCTDGLYHLAGREALIASRRLRYRLALKKLRWAKLAANCLRYFPWVRAVAIYSSLSLKNSRQQGDIDLFFITADKRVWSARCFINLALSLLQLRPTASNGQDKICTSFFVDEKNLGLSVFNDNEDYYYTYGVAAFTFLAGDAGTISSFFSANDWIKKTLPNWQPSLGKTYHPDTQILLTFQKLCETLLGLLPEKSLRDWQLKIMPRKYRDNQDGKKIRLSSQAIKMHDNDKRGRFNELFSANFNKSVNNYEKND